MTDKDALLAANAAYYHAFARADFSGMSRVWAEDDVSCVHPGWPVLIGRKPVLESYRDILSNPAQERIQHGNDIALVAAHEGRVHCVEFVGGVALAATNWFRRVDGDWRMIHHQASPIAALVEQGPQAAPQRLN
jgi:ketosteroid isomerase-like protein